MAQGADDWEGAILATAHRLRRTPMRSVEDATLTPQWVARHAALVAACGSRRLVKLHAQLYEPSERYRGLSANVEGGDMESEHEALVDAALDRDAERLVDKTLAHIRLTTTLIVNEAGPRRAPPRRPDRVRRQPEAGERSDSSPGVGRAYAICASAAAKP